MNTEPIPSGFWPQIAHQLHRIATERADTFDAEHVDARLEVFIPSRWEVVE